MISQTAAEEGCADLAKLLSNLYSALNLKHIEASKDSDAPDDILGPAQTNTKCA